MLVAKGKRNAVLNDQRFSSPETNIRVSKENDLTEQLKYDSLKQIAENYYELSDDCNEGIIGLLNNLLKDATWGEALARAIAEILENKWMKDFPVLYKAMIDLLKCGLQFYSVAWTKEGKSNCEDEELSL